MSRRKKNLKRCNATGLVIFASELEAKIVLARRVWSDKGEDHAFECPKNKHWHLGRPLTRATPDGKIEA